MCKEMQWRVHTANLLKEILNNNSTGLLEKPISILGKLLAQVGERAALIGDPVLDELMIRLTIYTVADPESPDYDPELVNKYLNGNTPAP